MRVVVVREYTDKYTGEGHVIGEKLELAYYGKIEAEATIAYIHPGNKLATVIGFNKDADTQVKKDIAMQAAGRPNIMNGNLPAINLVVPETIVDIVSASAPTILCIFPN